MIRPDVALTGIDNTLSLGVSAAMAERQPRLLAWVRRGHVAERAVHIGLTGSFTLLGAGLFAPANLLIWFVAGAAVTAAAGLLLFRSVALRAGAAWDQVRAIVRADYGATLVRIRKHDLVVTAERSLIRAAGRTR